MRLSCFPKCYSFALFSVILSMVQTINGGGKITVCTYNLWNVMFSWEVRMRHIGTMVRDAACDVVVLQEVRIHADRSRSQADFLQRLLPGFNWVVTRLADQVTKPALSYWTGWEMEGLAVLSRLPIGTTWVEKLSKVHGPDSNQRIALHVPVLIPSGATVNIIAVHLSYHRQQQCQNVAEILQYIDRNRLHNVVVAGDLNVYPDFTDPVRLFQTGGRNAGAKGNRCQFSLMSELSLSSPAFQDVWEVTNKHSPGLTFSNMPEPGLTSRPDRILASHSVQPTQVSLLGYGTTYKTRHASDIFVHRLHRVMAATKESFGKHAGYSCLQECGPHGVCRCGVCVKSGERGTCQLLDCDECSPTVFLKLLLFFSAAVVLFLTAGLAAVKILVVAARIDQSEGSVVQGFSCCLCNPDIVRKSTVTARHRVGKFLHFVGVGKLPPVFLLMLTLMAMLLLFAMASVVLKPVMDTAGDVMVEEYFPSDHLMIAAKLSVE